jgi:NAD(P)-dependent dehydrogenase (short-subunit alcohol dehydrogenase family)
MTPDTLSLAGKVAIVTGSGRENGIGAAIAIALSRNGAAVVINYVSESSEARAAGVAKTIQAAGGQAIVVKAGVNTSEGANHLVQETLKRFKTDHIDILVNNAGAGFIGSTLEATKEEIDLTFGVNVYGTIFLVQAAVPHMPRGGRIINISSVASKLGLDFLPIYGASKAALDSLSYAWAKEFGRSRGITVNSVAPGPVDTDIAKAADPTSTGGNILVDMTRAEERVGKTEDIADVVLFLASEKSRWITGQFVSASGGITGQ